MSLSFEENVNTRSSNTTQTLRENVPDSQQGDSRGQMPQMSQPGAYRVGGQQRATEMVNGDVSDNQQVDAMAQMS